MTGRMLLLAGLSLSLGAFAVGSSPVARADEDEDEGESRMVQVPSRVKAAARKAVKGLEIEEAQVEAILIYEVEGTAKGKTYSLQITAEGKVIAREVEDDEDEDEDEDEDGDEDEDEDEDGDEDDEEEDEAEHELEIPVSALPDAVKAAAKKAVKGIKLTEAEVESVLVYELEGEAGDDEYELEVTADGKLLEVEEVED